MQIIDLESALRCSVCETELAAGGRAGVDGQNRVMCLNCLPIDSPSLRHHGKTSAARVYERRARPRKAAEGDPGEWLLREILHGIDGIPILHDRRLPESEGVVDHIAVSADAVWVIQVEHCAGAAITRAERGLRRHEERLLVGGEDQSVLVTAAARRTEAVAAIVDASGATVPVGGLLCFVDWVGDRAARPLVFSGVTVTWPRALPEILRRPGPVTEAQQRRIAAHLEHALPSV